MNLLRERSTISSILFLFFGWTTDPRSKNAYSPRIPWLKKSYIFRNFLLLIKEISLLIEKYLHWPGMEQVINLNISWKHNSNNLASESEKILVLIHSFINPKCHSCHFFHLSSLIGFLSLASSSVISLLSCIAHGYFELVWSLWNWRWPIVYNNTVK
jgi:hypothetical protein